MTSFPTGPGTVHSVTRRLLAPTLAALCATLVISGAALAQDGDGRAEVRVVGSCSAHATSKLKLKSRDGVIELEFEVDHNRAGTLWRLAIVHERRVVWRGAARTSGSSGSFDVRRTLPDLVGADTVTARAWGPAGVTCRATATLPAS